MSFLEVNDVANTSSDYNQNDLRRIGIMKLKKMDTKRAAVLLKAALDLLEKYNCSNCVLNAMEIEIEYDGVTNNGWCLKCDIEDLLDTIQPNS